MSSLNERKLASILLAILTDSANKDTIQMQNKTSYPDAKQDQLSRCKTRPVLIALI